MTRCLRGLDVCIGAWATEDTARNKRVSDRAIQMSKLKQFPVAIAQSLLKGGQQAIDNAKSIARTSDLPGGTARDKVYWALRWHEDALSKLSSTPNEIYQHGEDLKKHVMQAFAEWDASVEGAEQLNKAWSAMWTEIGQRIAALPKALAAAAGTVVKEAAFYTKAVFWAALGAAVLVTGLVGWGVSTGVRHKIERL